MAARPITDDLDYTLCRHHGNPSDRAAIKKSVYRVMDFPGFWKLPVL